MVITELTFIFENCEKVSFNGGFIGDFYIGKIKTEIRRTASNAIQKNGFM